MIVKINKKNVSDIFNLKYQVFKPLSEFVSKSEFMSIINTYTYKKKFFPFPIYLSIKSNIAFKNNKKLSLYYLNNKVCDLKLNSIYRLNKKKIIKKIFGTKNINHPGVHDFLNCGDYFLSGKIINFNKLFFDKFKEKFYSPESIKKKIKAKSIKKITGFHTRNVPHKAHEFLFSESLKETDGLLLQPMIIQYKKNEYNSEVLISSYKSLIKFYKNSKIIFSTFFSYPRYGGPREAALHALVRKNYGCSHFIVGRDHAGYKKFYKIYESQTFCKKISDLLKIKILDIKEPYFCKKCNLVVNSCDCKKKKIKF